MTITAPVGRDYPAQIATGEDGHCHNEDDQCENKDDQCHNEDGQCHSEDGQLVIMSVRITSDWMSHSQARIFSPL